MANVTLFYLKILLYQLFFCKKIADNQIIKVIEDFYIE